jgi:hypothetical protein
MELATTVECSVAQHRIDLDRFFSERRYPEESIKHDDDEDSAVLRAPQLWRSYTMQIPVWLRSRRRLLIRAPFLFSIPPVQHGNSQGSSELWRLGMSSHIENSQG